MSKHLQKEKFLTTKIGYQLINALAENLSIERMNNDQTRTDFLHLCANYGWSDLAHEIAKKGNKYNLEEIDKILAQPMTNPIMISKLFIWSEHDNPQNNEKIFKLNKNSMPTISDYCDPNPVNDKTLFVERSFEVAIQQCKNLTNINKIRIFTTNMDASNNLLNLFNNPTNNFKMVQYDGSMDKTKIKTTRMIHTPNSLYLLFDENDNYSFPDVLFIDGYHEIFKNITLNNGLEKKAIITVFIKFSVQSKYVFIIDKSQTKALYGTLMKKRLENK